MKTFYTFQKFIASCIVLFFCVQSFAINQIDGNWTEYGLTEEYDGYYVIATAEDLETFCSMGEGNGVVVADITVNESVLDENGELRSDWETTVTKRRSSYSSLSGTFDGRNHIISGIYISREDSYYVGLFYQAANGSIIKNVKIEDSYFKGRGCVGGICGSHNRNDDTITISNCTVNAYIHATLENAGGIYGGYIVSGGTIDNCLNLGTVVSEGGNVGGICGQWDGIITNCGNKGTVIGQGEFVGGIVGDGWLYQSGLYTSTISGCYNIGTISGLRSVGGIAGQGDTIIMSCNIGTINGETFIGGIAGCSERLENVFNNGKVSANAEYVGGLSGSAKDVFYSYNAGLVSSGSYLNNVGGLVGECTGTMTNCYYDSDVCPFKAVNNSPHSGAIGITSLELCSSTLLSGFDSEIWSAGTTDVSGEITPIDDEFAYVVNGQYPKLRNNEIIPFAQLQFFNVGTSSLPDWVAYVPIYSVDDLTKMETNSTGIFVLMNDITEFRNFANGKLLEIPTVLWTPITLFEGKLYGRGKIISGLLQSPSYIENGGLFGTIKNATISDVTIANSRFSGRFIGGIAGMVEGNTCIKNCNNFCSFDINNEDYAFIGGIFGYADFYYEEENDFMVKNCHNYGNINGNSTGQCGGIGGCIMDLYQLNVSNCSNSGYITGKCAGGILGSARAYDIPYIDQCINKGTITALSQEAGGIVADFSAININACLNVGEIINKGPGQTGGIAGGVNGGGFIWNCLNLGHMESVSTAGAICGGSAIVSTCYYNSDNCSYGAVINKDDYWNKGMTTSELINGELPSDFSPEYWAIRPAEIKDMKKYYYYPYLNCYGAESAILAMVRDCHSVTMNFNGGTTTDDVISFYVETEEAQLPRNMVKEGCTFAGWYDNSNYTSAAFIEIPLTETQPKTFYAKWIANNYTITYDLNGGTINSGKNTTYTYGYGVMLPTDVTKTGYTFKGWYDNPQCEGESILAIPANATGDKTYYANWVVNTYNVTFFTYEGVMDTDIDSYTFGKETVLPTDVTKSGYDFGGWYTNDSYSGVAIQSIASNETGDKMYYAKWNKKSYPVSVTFDRAMGSISGIDSYLHGDNAVLKAHADAGYDFAFWSCVDETVLEDKNVQDSTLTFVVTSPTELSATFKFKEIVYPAADFVIGTVKTEKEIAPIDLAMLFESSEGGEISYMVTSSSPNVLLPQIEDGKLYLATMGLQGKATITVTAKLANGNKSSLSAEAVVEYNCNIQVVPTIVNASCYGFSDGSISLSAENEYAYQWIGEDVTTNKIENVKAGNYSVQITDERGCKSLETYTVSQPDEISVEIAEVVNPRCGVQSEIHLNAAGDYTYAWSNGSTEKDLIGAEIGDYSVVVTNPETGCSITLTQSLELTFQKPQISLVTVSKETGKNLIVWVRENTDQIAYYTIYREGAQSKKYTAIGTVNYSEISVFQDDVAKPMTRQWSYKISATDVCGHETELSKAHTTLHLNEMESMHDGMAELIWQPYEGLDYNSFYIVRETKVNNYTFIDTVTTVPSTLTSYTAEIPPLGKSIFYVGVKLDKVIDPKQFMKAESGPFALALSNIAEAENMGNPDAVETMENAVEVSVISHTIFVKNAANKTIDVYGINGCKIVSVNGLETNTIDVVHDGVYFVVVDGKATKVLVK